MSTYYFLACDEHREYCDGASRSAGGVGHLADSEHTLPRFVYAHHGCTLRVYDEHEDGFDEYEEWTRENTEAMLDRASELGYASRKHP